MSTQKKQTIKKIIIALKQTNLSVQLSAQLFEVFTTKTVPSSVIASLIGVNPKTISKFYQSGIIEREIDGNYDLIKTMNKYINYLKEKSKKINQEYDTVIDRQKIIHYKAQQEEIKTYQLKRELAPISMIKHFFSFIDRLIQEIYRRPHEIGPDLSALYISKQDKKAEEKIIRELEAIIKRTVKELIDEMEAEGYKYKS